MNRLLLLAAVLPAVVFGAPPRHVTVQYDLSRNGSVMAEVRETLEHDGNSYKIVSEGRGRGIYALLAAGSVSRTSEGAITAGGLRPRQFRDQRGSRETAARFDWSGRKLVQEKKGMSETQPLPDNAQDRLSFLWNFAFAPPKGGPIEANVADGRGAPSRYRYAIAGTEVLKTAAGDFETLHLVKQRDPDDSRGTEIWLALKRDYVPVRILVVEKDGTRLDQVVTRIEG